MEEYIVLEEQNSIFPEKIEKLKLKKQKLKESEALFKIKLAKQVNATKALGFILIASWLFCNFLIYVNIISTM